MDAKRSFHKNRIMIFGTFDPLHKGHLNFFKQAKKIKKNSFLIVSVARDINVKKVKGSLPFLGEIKRAESVKLCKDVDLVVLGAIRNTLQHIQKHKPHIIALGYDQKEYVENLQKKLQKKGINVEICRLKAYMPHVYKSSIIKQKVV